MIGDQAILTGSVSTPAVAQKVARLVSAHMGEVQELKGRSTRLFKIFCRFVVNSK